MRLVQMAEFLTLASLLILSLSANAAPEERKRELYTGQASVTCHNQTIRLPQFPYNENLVGTRGPFLVFDEAICTPDSFSVNLESSDDCDGKSWCLLGQFSAFPRSDVPELEDFLARALSYKAIEVTAMGRSNGYYVPMNCPGCRLHKIVWWSEDLGKISILSARMQNSDATIQALAASVKAYMDGGQ